MSKQWQQKEKKDALVFKGKRTPRSGGLWFAKGDSKNEKYLIENKTTAKESFSISTHLWEKIENEALLSHRIPMISLEIGKRQLEVVVLEINDFISLTGEKDGLPKLE